MSAPWLEVFLPLEMILLIEKVFRSLDIRRANFSAVEQIVICKQCYLKNAKAYVCLEVFENAVFNKTSEFL